MSKVFPTVAKTTHSERLRESEDVFGEPNFIARTSECQDLWGSVLCTSYVTVFIYKTKLVMA